MLRAHRQLIDQEAHPADRFCHREIAATDGAFSNWFATVERLVPTRDKSIQPKPARTRGVAKTINESLGILLDIDENCLRSLLIFFRDFS